MKDREKWLAERRTGLGGSDAAPAVGMSKFKTPLELYLDKRGELETNENEPMRWGNLLEPVIRQEYSNRTGRTVIVPQGIVRHPTVEFAFFTPDGIADGSRVLQCKSARTAEGWGEPGTDEVPMEYLLQVQHEMFVACLPIADLALLIGGSDFRIYTVEADTDLQQLLMNHEAEFWSRVLRGNPPDPISRDDVRRRWKIATSGRAVGADDELAITAHKLAAVKAILKTAEALEDELAAEIQGYMTDAEQITHGGDVLATWKNVKTNPRFDLDRFKEEQPELYAQYLRDAKAQRRFLLKVKGESCLPELLNALPQPKLLATATP